MTDTDKTQDRVVIFDTTLRDGEQAPGYSMRIHEKVRLAKQLDRLGVDLIEAGFPIASEADAEAVKAVAAAVRRPIIAGLARAASGDIDDAPTDMPGSYGNAVAALQIEVKRLKKENAELALTAAAKPAPQSTESPSEVFKKLN